MQIIRFLILLLLIPAAALGEPLLLAFDHYPPFEYMANGQLKGENAELVNTACRRLGIQPKFIETPFARALYDVETGSIDGIFSLFQTPERKKIMFYADEPLGETRTAIVTRQGNQVDWNGLDSLDNYVVGRVRGYSHGPEVDARLKHATEVKDNVLLVKMLDSRHIDIALCNFDALQHVHDMLGLKWRVVVLKDLQRKPLYIGFSRKLGERGRELARKFEKALIEIKRERRDRPE